MTSKAIDRDIVIPKFDGPTTPESIVREIESLERGPNIGTEGAAEITVDTCQAAIAFLDEIQSRLPGIPAPRSVCPSVDGEISIYWKAHVGRLSVKIGAERSQLISYQYKDREGRYTFGAETLEDILNKLAEMLTAG